MIPFTDPFIGTSWFVSLPLYLSDELGIGLSTLGIVSGRQVPRMEALDVRDRNRDDAWMTAFPQLSPKHRAVAV